MKRERQVVTVYDPKYILRLDDLPKCVEADGTVWPVFLTAREMARVFHVRETQVLRWIERFDLPVLHLGRRYYMSVADFNDWLISKTTTFSLAREAGAEHDMVLDNRSDDDDDGEWEASDD